jgi:hypothetical protein
MKCWAGTDAMNNVSPNQQVPGYSPRTVTNRKTFAAFTIYEYSPKRGTHLHVVVKGIPDLDVAWLKHVVSLQANGTQIHVVPIGQADQDKMLDEHGISHYLTKQIADKKLMAGWPRGFRITSSTRKWCPEWMSRRAWGDYQRSLKAQVHHA